MDNLKEAFLEKREKNKFYTILSIVFGFVTIAGLSVLLGIAISKDDRITDLEMETQKLSNIIDKDLQIQKVKNITNSFISSANEHNIEKYFSFFSDTIERLYLLSNVTKEEAQYKITWYWKKYPDLVLEHDTSKMVIGKWDGYYRVLLPTLTLDKAGKSYSVVSEIRFNSNFKITYIRDYFAEKSD
jgi:hypothetical protein